jgi:hypothetical protein
MKSFSYYRRRAGLSVKEVGELLKVSVETAAETAKLLSMMNDVNLDIDANFIG